MARPPARSRAPKQSPSAPTSPVEPTAPTSGDYTGRYLVLFRDDGMKEGLDAVKNATGLASVCSAAAFESSAVEMSQADSSEVFVLDELKVAVVDADPSQGYRLQAAAAEDGAILAVEPERIMYAIDDAIDHAPLPLDYLRGYRDAVNHLYDSLAGGAAAAEAAEAALAAAFADDAQFTWGLQATRAAQSSFSGRGVRVAVLDTGFNLRHPDFAGRPIIGQSFIPGQPVEDGAGHGTHCAGTALGPRLPPGGVRRYGCAFGAEMYIGKVLSDQGSGADRGILAGINWAIANECRVVSMSLGARVFPGESFSPLYENVARRALASDPGTLIIAAAGNDSRDRVTGRRISPPNPVSRPANCPSILAVAALDSRLAVAPFSNGGVNPQGGGVDIAGPGVAIFSSAPDPAVSDWPARYHTISGTSMATPHVAGIAALWVEALGGRASPQALWQALTGHARRLPLANQDVGAGLVQAP